ncbi:MAG TPA: hypothetical protein VGM37_15130 [Armatimonadota bacterium]|jgi:hypothetical protein
MKRRIFLMLVIALSASPRALAQGSFVFDSREGPAILPVTMVPHLLDAMRFSSDPNNPAPTPFAITRIWYAVGSTAPDTYEWDTVIDFWDTVNPSAPAGEPVASGPLGTQVDRFSPGFFLDGFYGPDDANGWLLSKPIIIPDDDFAVEISFTKVGDKTIPAMGVTTLISQAAVGVGWSGDEVYRDVDGNGIIDASDRKTADGNPPMNLYIALYGQQIVQALEFTSQPQGGRAGAPLDVQPVVIEYDAQSAPVAYSRGPVTIALKPGVGPPNARLLGARIVHCAGGVASFGGLAIDLPGTYQLVASVGAASVESAPFTIAPGGFTVQDAAEALRVSAGFLSPVGDAFTRLNAETAGASAGRIDGQDAIRIARRAVGLDPNN